MKDIDIIKAAQHVDDKFVSEAIDFAPIRRSSFKWGYAAAAACAALVITAVPIIARYRAASAPGTSESSSGTNASNSSTTPTVADTKLADNTPKTFYKVVTGEPVSEPGRADYGWINITDALAKRLSQPHDQQDLFAVSVSEHNNADIQNIYDEFAKLYDENDWFLDTLGKGALFMTSEQIKTVSQNKAPSGLTIVLDLAAADYRAEEIDADALKTERFGKIYAEIQLDNNYDKLATELDIPRAGTIYGGGHEVGNPETRKIIEQYIIDFAKDYDVDTQQFYAGEDRDIERQFYAGVIDSYNGKLCGEFDLETIKKMLDDERVVSICKSNGGGYVYENYGLFLSTVKVTRKQMEKLPSGLTYREIFERLGNTAAFGRLKTRFYVTEDAKLIILNYDSVNDVCTLSGNELYDSAIPLYYDGERPNTVDNDMIYAVTGIYGLFINLNSNGYLTAGDGDQAPEGCEIIHEDGTPAEKEELHQIGRRVFFKAEYQLESYPPQYKCTKIVLLDS